MTQIELTQQEIELLFEALDDWERVPTQRAMSDAMATMMTTRDAQETRQATDQIISKARQKELMRKRQSIMLKAKLIQSLECSAASSLFNAVTEDAKCSPET